MASLLWWRSGQRIVLEYGNTCSAPGDEDPRVRREMCTFVRVVSKQGNRCVKFVLFDINPGAYKSAQKVQTATGGSFVLSRAMTRSFPCYITVVRAHDHAHSWPVQLKAHRFAGVHR